MKNRITSIMLMALWMFVVLGLSYTSVPPRHLTLSHMLQFSMIPLGAFLAALPNVPRRWFAYAAALAVAPQIAMFSYHIRGTSYRLGWDKGIARTLLPILIIVAVVAASMLAAWVRQIIQSGIEKQKGHANQTLKRTRQSRARQASVLHKEAPE
jgi:hypothetical protein